MYSLAVGINYEEAFDWSLDIQSGTADEKIVRELEAYGGVKADTIIVVSNGDETGPNVRMIRQIGVK